MKFYIYFIILLFCVVITINAKKKKKCGNLAEKCMVLSNGDVFWPSDYSTQCVHLPMCPTGYKLHKKTFGSVQACCCIYRRMKVCPDCDMSVAKKISYYQWIEMNMSRNGPPDGKCEDGKMKRIFFGKSSKLDKCCCEPPTSRFLR